MHATEPTKFKHTTLTAMPRVIAGITLLDEEPGFTGIYLRDPDGGLWPARTVSRMVQEHHDDVCDSWLARPGANEDKRNYFPISFDAYVDSELLSRHSVRTQTERDSVIQSIGRCYRGKKIEARNEVRNEVK